MVCSWSKWNLNGLYRSKVEAKSRRKVWLTGGTGRLHHNCQGRPRLFLSPTCELHSSHYTNHCLSVIRRHGLTVKTKTKTLAKPFMKYLVSVANLKLQSSHHIGKLYEWNNLWESETSTQREGIYEGEGNTNISFAKFCFLLHLRVSMIWLGNEDKKIDLAKTNWFANDIILQ